MAARVGIEYILPEDETREVDTTIILHAVSAYEDTVRPGAYPEAFVAELPDGGTKLSVFRDFPDARTLADATEGAEAIRRKVETHFPEESKARLSKRFAGIAIPPGLEGE